MTASKAHAGGTAAFLASALMTLLQSTPWVAAMTMEQQGALGALVTAALTWGAIYLSPANTEPQR